MQSVFGDGIISIHRSLGRQCEAVTIDLNLHLHEAGVVSLVITPV